MKIQYKHIKSNHVILHLIAAFQQHMFAEQSGDAVQGLLGAFVDYIKERKTVALEDLAAEFGLRVQASLMYTACCNRHTFGLLSHLLACKQRSCHSAYTQELQVKSAHEPVSEAEHTPSCSITCVNSGIHCCC